MTPEPMEWPQELQKAAWERTQKATPGPWQAHHRPSVSYVAANTKIADVYSTAFRDRFNQEANAELIAAARTDLPDAIAHIAWQNVRHQNTLDAYGVCIDTALKRDAEIERLRAALLRNRQGYLNILEMRKLDAEKWGQADGYGGRYGALTRQEIETVIAQIDIALDPTPSVPEAVPFHVCTQCGHERHIEQCRADAPNAQLRCGCMYIYLEPLPEAVPAKECLECSHCGGCGKVRYYHGDFDTCPTCHGLGKVVESVPVKAAGPEEVGEK